MGYTERRHQKEEVWVHSFIYLYFLTMALMRPVWSSSCSCNFSSIIYTVPFCLPTEASYFLILKLWGQINFFFSDFYCVILPYQQKVQLILCDYSFPKLVIVFIYMSLFPVYEFVTLCDLILCIQLIIFIFKSLV